MGNHFSPRLLYNRFPDWKSRMVESDHRTHWWAGENWALANYSYMIIIYTKHRLYGYVLWKCIIFSVINIISHCLKWKWNGWVFYLSNTDIQNSRNMVLWYVLKYIWICHIRIQTFTQCDKWHSHLWKDGSTAFIHRIAVIAHNA